MVEAAGKAAACQAWLAARAIRRSVQKEIDEVKESAVPDKSTVDRFRNLDTMMEQYRLKCIETLWLDIDFASKERVEHSLWQTHSALNSAYRTVRDKLFSPKLAVLKQKINKLYINYLKITQFFYKGYLQRLCARYDLPDLQRMREGAALEEIKVPDEDRVDATAAGIEKQVLASCHLTLIYLGDLGRYRALLRKPEERKFDAALAYYSLANDLDPHSGYGHHQMGAIFLEEKKHFDKVYRFYRALAADKPHPNAGKNLETAFRELRRPTRPTFSKAQGPYAALQEWFIRLHAHFYRGEEFSQHEELEKEVIHRFGTAVESHDYGLGLLKMILINICAYQVAKDRIASKWTAEGSQSCQFILRLNVRTISVIARQLQPALVDVMGSANILANGTENHDAILPVGISALVQDALPLLRVYMTWLCMYRSDIVQFQAHLQPHATDMYKSLSQVLTRLFDLVDISAGFKRVRCLFQEDVECLGVKALSGPLLPRACLLGSDPVTGEPKRRQEGDRLMDIKPDNIAFTRALDITYRAVVLTDGTDFPLVISPRQGDGGHLAKVTFLEDANPSSGKSIGILEAPAYTEPSATVEQITTSVHPLSAVADTELTSGPRPADMMELQNGQGALSPTRNRVASSKWLKPDLAQAPEESESPFDQESGMESRMYDLVDNLVEPIESPSLKSPSGHEETSYGMHTNTAREVFGAVVSSTSPGVTPGSAKFPALPWDYFYKPSPQQTGLSTGSPQNPWPGTSGSPQPFSNRSSTNAVNRQGSNNGYNPFAPGDDARIRSHHPKKSIDNVPYDALVSREYGDQPGSRQQGSVAAMRSPSRALPEPGLRTNSPWEQRSMNFTSVQDALTAQLSALVPGASPVVATPASTTQAAGSSFPSINFSGNTSTLPPVNSPYGIGYDPFGYGQNRTQNAMAPPPGFDMGNTQPSSSNAFTVSGRAAWTTYGLANDSSQVDASSSRNLSNNKGKGKAVANTAFESASSLDSVLPQNFRDPSYRTSTAADSDQFLKDLLGSHFKSAFK